MLKGISLEGGGVQLDSKNLGSIRQNLQFKLFGKDKQEKTVKFWLFSALDAAAVFLFLRSQYV